MTGPPVVEIPGDPSALRRFADTLSTSEGRFKAAGEALRRVDVDTGWAGEAGDAFRQRFSGYPSQWIVAGDAYVAAAAAVSRYADTLEWAQRRASQLAQQQAAAAVRSQQAVESYNRAATQGIAQPAFVDPGAVAQQVVAEELDAVLEQVQRAGDDAAATVNSAAAQAPPKSFWGRLGDRVADAVDTAGAVGSAVGQAALDSPGAVVAAATGAAAVVAGSAGVLGGGAVSVTGVGAVAGVPAAAASGVLAAGGAATIGAAAMEMARKARDNYSRPSRHRKGVRETAYDNSKGPDEKVRDPGTGNEIKKSDQWDMGHKPGQEFRKHQKDARERGISRKDFLDEHNDPGKYRPETPNTNRSHRLEEPDDFGGS